MRDSATYHEITTQTKAWAGAITAVTIQTTALQQLWQDGGYNNVVFTGCGSTHYLSLAAASLWQSLIDVPAKGVPGGEVYLYPQATFGPVAVDKTLLIAISRSGTTTETVTVTKQFKANGGGVVVITNYGNSPLGDLGDVTIAIPEGQEESVAQTRSFASMYMAVTILIVTLAGRDDLLAEMAKLPAAGDKLIANYEQQARKIGENLDYDRFYFLGSGPRYGLACEVNLKMKEMTLTHSEPFHFFEFRHGPMSMVNEKAVVVGLLSEEQQVQETAVLHEMEKLGGQIFSLAESDADVNFHSQVPFEIRNVLYLPVLQLLAYYRSVAKGLNPDRPNNLTAVVELDLA
jgi:glucosamine--fructose-6-phosphate aminotransferase (isomerizing)